MTILSSRQHTCIHPKISKSSKKNELCRDLVKGKNLKNEDKEVGVRLGLDKIISVFVKFYSYSQACR